MKEITEVVNFELFQTTFALRDPESSSKHEHTHTLNEVQRRAYRIHERHGGIYGGYTLEDWLEAEHELDEEENPLAPKDDQIH
ncbi:MAG TPA: DUF2934 domain-containing protein [Candidatus Acidoferrales bacterium]